VKVGSFDIFHLIAPAIPRADAAKYRRNGKFAALFIISPAAPPPFSDFAILAGVTPRAAAARE